MISASQLVTSFLMLTLTGPAWALPSNVDLAARHFQLGLEHADASELDSAASEFEKAYELSPNFAVLYNLARIYGALGRSVEALDAFSRFLADGGAAITPQRRAEVEGLISIHQKRIGIVEIGVEPETADVQIDGSLLPRERRTVPLVNGRHVLVVSAPRHNPEVRILSVEPQKSTPVHVHLQPEPDAVPSLAGLSIRCPVPDVRVSIDGAVRGFTPFSAPVEVTRQSHRLTFDRPGYGSSTRDCSPLSPTACECGVEPLRPLGAAGAALTIRVSEPNAQILVDGALWNQSTVPFGRHRLQVNKFGFQSYQQDFEARRGEVTHLDATLRIERSYAIEHRQRISNQHLIGYGLLGTGGAFLVTAGVLALASSHVYNDWRHSNDALQSAPSNATNLPNLKRQADGRALRVRSLDDWSLSAAIAGAGLLGAGAAVLLSSEDAKRYELPTPRVSRDGLTVAWQHVF
ncbi:MAG: tetratricopeptide repeat protein [Polyangiaceae bacterium]